MNPLLTWSTHTILKHHQQAHCVLGFCLVQKWFCTPHHGFWGFWIRLCGGRKAMDHVKHMIPYRANKLIVFCWWYASAGELHLPAGPTELWFFRLTSDLDLTHSSCWKMLVPSRPHHGESLAPRYRRYLPPRSSVGQWPPIFTNITVYSAEGGL